MNLDVESLLGSRFERPAAPWPGRYTGTAARCVVSTGPRWSGRALLWGVLTANRGGLVLDTPGIRGADLSLDVRSLRTPIPLLARWLWRDRLLSAGTHPVIEFSSDWSVWTEDGSVVFDGTLTVRGRSHKLLLSGRLERVGDRKIAMWLSGNLPESAFRSPVLRRIVRRGLKIDLVAELTR